MLLAVFASGVQAADETKSHEGLIVSAAADKLVMTDKEGKNEHSHMLSTATKITLNGQPAKIADLKKGQVVKVTVLTKDGKASVTAIDARSTNL